MLMAQRFLARGEAVAAMKADGIEYDERMELLEEVTWPKPLAELLETAFLAYQRTHPWCARATSPKSVVRDLYERAATFGDFFRRLHRLARVRASCSATSDAYRALRHSVPATARTPELDDLVEWLGDRIQTDSSLLEEWESSRARMTPRAPSGGGGAGAGPSTGSDTPRPGDAARALSANPRALRVMVRTSMGRRVELVARQRWDDLADLDARAPPSRATGPPSVSGRSPPTSGRRPVRPTSPSMPTWGSAPDARGRASTSAPAARPRVRPQPRRCPPRRLPPTILRRSVRPRRPGSRVWLVQQVLDDPNGDRDWRLTALVDLDACDDSGELALAVTAFACGITPQIFKDTPLEAF